jgi:uncharacterized lipoprotein YddW (UPF0748 family)
MLKISSPARLALLALAGATLVACQTTKSAAVKVESAARGAISAAAPADGIPAPAREFRAAWVATVANIDWPSTNTLSTIEQQAEMVAILDTAADLNLNALIFQARPTADAFYPSELEPWSEYLTGTQGKAPEPFYDPLELWVAEAHKRGIELHVWFNPYRAWHTTGKSAPAPNAPRVAKSDITLRLANGMYWMDPAEPATQQHSLDVVLDVVRRYDIDGVHFDDYFYPYDSYNNGKDFPDDASWGRYQASGGTMTRNDWRRDAVNKFVRSIHVESHKINPRIKFGMSPFGIWRPGHPPTIQGLDQYDRLFADAKLWLNEGWVDYWTPQLYWPIRQIPQSFPVLLQWWDDQNTKGVHLWPGLGTYRAGDEKWGPKEEVLNQVQISRAIASEGPGQVHFSFKTLQNDKAGVATALKETVYAKQALVPASTWLDDEAPSAPTFTVSADTVSITATGDEKPFLYVVYRREGEKWGNYEIISALDGTYTLPAPKDEKSVTDNVGGGTQVTTRKASNVTAVAVSAVDRSGNESTRTIVELKPATGG